MRWLWFSALVCLPLNPQVKAQDSAGGLQVRFGSNGLEKISFRGQVLEDVAKWPDDAFHIWHMLCLDKSGKRLTTGSYGWGESNLGKRWDAADKTWTYTFPWGTLQARYVLRVDSIDLQVTEFNRPDSGVIFDGASVYPVTLHLPGQVAGARIIDNLQQPGVTAVRWSGGEATVVAPDATQVIFSGFQTGNDGTYAAIVSGTLPDALHDPVANTGRALRPGQTSNYTVSIRFAASDVALNITARDAYESFVTRWPATLAWKDRRVIGTVFLGSSAQGDKTKATGFPGNPRRYFSDPSIDITSTDGLAHLQGRVLEQARAVVTNLKRMDAQGVITWDIEGEQYPQDTSYVCAPDQIAQVAPEMESVILDRSSRFAGMKLADAYFKMIRDAGFRVGVCVRPQRFSLRADASASQEYLPDGQVAAELIRKMKYAHDRWGATIFYLDSTVKANGLPLDASIVEKAAAAMPDSLLIPEESTPRMCRATVPFLTFLFHGDLGVDRQVRDLYPHAFGVNLINDVNYAKLAAHQSELTDAVRLGDVLMVHAGYWHPNNGVIVEMYRRAYGSRD